MAMKDKQEQNNSLASSHAKGERLRRLRHLANLSREAFCLDGEISLTTLISWEVGRFGGLSAKGATRVIARVAKEGVFCTLEWLLYEIGSGPEVNTDYKKLQTSSELNKDEFSAPLQELMLFRKLNHPAIDLLIADDAMAPHYQKGDYVAGTKRFGAQIASLITLDCIVQTTDGSLFLRNLQLGPRKNSYNLIPTNHQTTTSAAIIYDTEVIAAAPILWHRRCELPF